MKNYLDIDAVQIRDLSLPELEEYKQALLKKHDQLAKKQLCCIAVAPSFAACSAYTGFKAITSFIQGEPIVGLIGLGTCLIAGGVSYIAIKMSKKQNIRIDAVESETSAVERQMRRR